MHFFLDLCRLFVFRFIQGCGLGGEVPVAATYVNELARAKGRGTFVLLYELVFTFGLLAAAALGLLVVPNFGWRVMFVIGAAIGFVVPWLRRSLPESPRWLAGQLRFDEAERSLAMIEDEVSEHGRVPLPPVNPNFAAPEVKKTSWAELLQGMYLRRTLTVWVIWFCGPFCAFGLFTWLPTLYTSVYKMPLRTGMRYTLFAQVAGVISAALCALLIDRLGRRKVFVGGFLCLAVFMAALWTRANPSTGTLVFLASGAYFWGSFICIALWLYTPEVYPTRMRALGSGIAAGWSRIGIFMAPILVGVIVGHSSVPWAFGMFAVVALFGAVVTAALATETKGRVLEEVSP